MKYIDKNIAVFDQFAQTITDNGGIADSRQTLVIAPQYEGKDVFLYSKFCFYFISDRF